MQSLCFLTPAPPLVRVVQLLALMVYYITSFVCQILLGILAPLIVAWFSRHGYRIQYSHHRNLGILGDQPRIVLR